MEYGKFTDSKSRIIKAFKGESKMSLQKKSVALFLLLSVLLSGCGTIISQYVLHKQMNETTADSSKTVNKEETILFVYSGTRMDGHMVIEPFACMFGIKGGEGCWGVMLYGPILVPVGIIDFPLSCGTDTLILPYTIYRDFNRR
jgi:uncharacterized protein YceK